MSRVEKSEKSERSERSERAERSEKSESKVVENSTSFSSPGCEPDARSDHLPVFEVHPFFATPQNSSTRDPWPASVSKRFLPVIPKRYQHSGDIPWYLAWHCPLQC